MTESVLEKHVDLDVFKVKQPCCSCCKKESLNFEVQENPNGMDLITWYCQNLECGFYIIIEIL